MELQKIDNVLTEVIIAYDAETGEALHVHEEFTEIIVGEAPSRPAPDEQRERDVMTAARQTFPDRAIKTLVTDASNAPKEGERLEVDPGTRAVRKRKIRGGVFPSRS